MYVYSRSNVSYSQYGLTLRRIQRTQRNLQRKVDRAEEKLQREKAIEAKNNIQNKPVRPQSPESIKSSLLGDFMFSPGGAASGTFVEILSNGINKGGTGSWLDILDSGDKGGVGMLDIAAGTGGGNLMNIVTGITSGSIIQPTAVSEQIVDPLTQKAQSIIAMNQIGSILNASA